MKLHRILLNLLAPLVPVAINRWLAERDRTVLDRLRAL
jgi:hypothetical protein